MLKNIDWARAVLKIISIDEFLVKDHVGDELKIASNSFNIKPLITNAIQTSSKGTFIFQNVVITMIPGEFAVVQIMIDHLEENEIQSQFGQNRINFLIHSRSCQKGETFTNEGECEKCIPGYYLLRPPDHIKHCKECV